jgi:hypothetical protein
MITSLNLYASTQCNGLDPYDGVEARLRNLRRMRTLWTKPYTIDKEVRDGCVRARDTYTTEAYVVDKGTRDIYIRTVSILGCFLSYSSLNILSSLGCRVDLEP